MAGETDRRELLSAGGVAAGGTALPGVAQVTDNGELDEIHMGRRRFVEIVLEHDDTPPSPIAHSCGRVPHVVDEDGGRVGLTSAPLAPFAANDDVVSYNGGYARRTVGQALDVSDGVRRLPVDVHPSGTVTRSLILERSYDVPEIEMEATDGSRTAVKAGDTVVDVGPGREESVALPERTVAVRRLGDSFHRVENPRSDGPETVRVREPGPVETVSVTPRVSVRDHGPVEVYGGEDDRVLLPRSRSGYAERRRAALRAMLSDAATERLGNGFVVERR